MLSHRVTLFLGSTAFAVVATISAGWLVAASGDDSVNGTSSASDSTSSDLNTASQKTFENSGTFVDVTDNPVSLPSEKVIYPPSTGGAGLASRETSTLLAFLLLAMTLTLAAGARTATTPRRARD